MQKMPNGFYTLLWAQFFSSWADNALLIVAIAHLQAQGESGWMVPLLKFGFTLAYVLLAPWVGASADGWNKSNIMWAAHALKLTGVMGMATGVDPLGAYALVGVGAALYSPAKYGWMSQMVPPYQLVKANGWIETSTVCAAIGGVACGGWWVSASYLLAFESILPWLPSANPGLSPSYLAVVLFYLITVCMTLAVPSASLQTVSRISWFKRPAQFLMHDLQVLWQDSLARVSLCITTLFWGVGACMQLLVLDWAQHGLGLTLGQGAYLQGLSGVGVMLGAWCAGRCITLQGHRKVLWCGVALGLLLPLMCLIQNWVWALPMTMGMGALGGLLVVPMNAMLQHRGIQVLTAGRSVAVQNFNENLSILCMLALYAGVVQFGASWVFMLMVFSVSMASISFWFMRSGASAPQAPAPCTGDHPTPDRVPGGTA